jgi:hypothetical protein
MEKKQKNKREEAQINIRPPYIVKNTMYVVFHVNKTDPTFARNINRDISLCEEHLP